MVKVPYGDHDPIWGAIRDEVEKEIAKEPVLASYLHATIMNHRTLDDVLSFVLSTRLGSGVVDAMRMREMMDEALLVDPSIGESFRADLTAVFERDPAVDRRFVPLLYFKGFQALQAYRIAHFLWKQGREVFAYFMQSRISEVFALDIHPAAKIGKGILLDHATGIVIGETAVVEDDVSILHEVTLGGTGKDSGDRHPKVRKGVLIGAGAKILGNVTIGEGAKIGACSVVLNDVCPHCTVAGVPAKPVGRAVHTEPALFMEHNLDNDVEITQTCQVNCGLCKNEEC
jgi:serine O-acetyltransferase